MEQYEHRRSICLPSSPTQGYVDVAKRLLRHPCRMAPHTAENCETKPNPESTVSKTQSKMSANVKASPSGVSKCPMNGASSTPRSPAPTSSTVSAALGPDPLPTHSACNRRVNLCDLGNHSGQFPLIEAVLGRHGQVGNGLNRMLDQVNVCVARQFARMDSDRKQSQR